MRERHEVYLITEIPCVIVLTPETYYKIKISSPEEIINRSIERNYKRPLKNSYMIFMIDCSETFKVKKKKKKIVKIIFHYFGTSLQKKLETNIQKFLKIIRD
jgi:hypothetical protein